MKKVLSSIGNFFKTVGLAIADFFKMIGRKIHAAYKAILRKFNNFRLTSIVLAAVNLLVGLTGLGLLFIYYFAGDISKTTKSRMPSFTIEKSLGTNGRIMGMIFFLSCIIVIILSIVVVYQSLPLIKNKEKLSPKKSNLMFAVVNGVFQIVVLVFSVLAIVLETPKTLVWYIVTMPIMGITLISNILWIVPFLKCAFYQPAVGTKLCPKKEAAAQEEATAEAK